LLILLQNQNRSTKFLLLQNYVIFGFKIFIHYFCCKVFYQYYLEIIKLIEN